LSWPKTLVKKWFNIKNRAEDFQADDDDYEERSSRRSSDRVRRGKIDHEASQVTDVNNYKYAAYALVLFSWTIYIIETAVLSPSFYFSRGHRIFVATWNVAGKSPPSYLNLEDWLQTSPPADIYVLGKWLALIRKTLNSLPGTSGGCHTPSPTPDPIVELDADFEGSTRPKASSFFHRRSFQSLSRSMRMDNEMALSQPQLDRRFSVCDRVIFGHRPSDYDPNFRWGSSDDENGPGDSPVNTHYSPVTYSGSLFTEDRDRPCGPSRYCLVASKQMVGIFLTVWVKSDLRDSVRNMKVSCVGRGLMGYLGNKGSISISMSLHQTSFCFICSHLTSGQKEGDELRRNSDVMEIIRKTRFPKVHGIGDENSPQTILEHDRIIWLGDLNYRIALSYRFAKALVEMRNWRALLENDQLRIEQRKGHVFNGWSEGKIYFPPTYKYSNNSDRYAGEDRHPKEKRRTPAWCDRILWYGRGLHQLSYVRGESRFSDHRPVYSIFLAEVESVNRSRIKKSMSCSSARIEVEELLPQSHGYSELNLY
ncbi:hypothetical protein CISIN_1g039092mg, partial [Citrus sinensis]